MLKVFRFNFYLMIFRENMRIKALLFMLLFLSLSVACEVNAMGDCIKGNCANGEGTYKYADGSEYTGQWKNDNFNGKGKFSYSDGSVYIGQWTNSKRDGEGTYTSSGGSIYKGQWKNDKFDGQGSYIYQDGSQYQGRWKNNMRNGQGSYSTAGGTKYQGQWKNGKLIGRVNVITPDGNIFIGQFNKDGKLIGQFTPLAEKDTAVKGKTEQELKAKPEAGQKIKDETIAKTKIATIAGTEVAAMAKTEPETKAKSKTEPKAGTEPATKARTEPESTAKVEPEAQAKVELETQAKAEPEAQAKSKPETMAKTEEAKKKNEIPTPEASKLSQDNKAGTVPDKKILIGPFGMKFVYISPGTFMMGSSEEESGRYDNEIQHRVTLTQGFYLQITEVTQGQWASVMGHNPSFFNGCGDDCPVEQVSWNDTQQFIWRLNQLEGDNKYRLPTEAEWEYACRAGSTAAFSADGIDALECGHDDNMAAVAWYCGNSGKKSHPVAQKNANAWGLYDMHGNVSELCLDWYGEYPPDKVTDPNGAASGLDRSVRGGGWDSHARHCRSACRGAVSSGENTYDVGFRLVMMP